MCLGCLVEKFYWWLRLEEPAQRGLSLSTLQVNQRASVIKINGQMPLRAFLAEEGLGCGSIIYVEGIGANGAMLLTLEEKIIHLHQTKKNMADALLEGGDISAGLSREELVELLKTAMS